jgi:hypothetical protein
MPLEVEIVDVRDTSPYRPLARRDFEHFFEETHRRLMRQAVECGHQNLYSILFAFYRCTVPI